MMASIENEFVHLLEELDVVEDLGTIGDTLVLGLSMMIDVLPCFLFFFGTVVESTFGDGEEGKEVLVVLVVSRTTNGL